MIFHWYITRRDILLENMRPGEDVAFTSSFLKNLSELLSTMTNVIGTTLKLAAPLFVPTLKSLYTLYDSIRSSNLDFENTQAAWFFSNLVEFGGEQAKPLFTPWLPFIVEMIDHPADVRQAAVYGLGVTAELHPDVFRGFKTQVLQGLHRVITMDESREEENIFHRKRHQCTRENHSTPWRVLRYWL